MFAAADENVRRDADFAQLRDRLLRRLGFQFTRRLDERHVGDVDENDIVGPTSSANSRIASRKGKTFDVAGRAADFGNDDIRLCCPPRLHGCDF